MIIHYYYRKVKMVRWRDLEHEWRDLEQIWFRAEKSVICEYITLLRANQVAGISSDFKIMMDITKYLTLLLMVYRTEMSWTGLQAWTNIQRKTFT